MTVIIGSLTSVNIDSQDSGFQSINWAIQTQNNRLWQLGDWSPYRTQITTTLTASVTAYASVLNAVDLIPSVSCTDSLATKRVRIEAGICGAGSIDTFDEEMYLTSYSYSKGDPNAFGTESWSFQKWVNSEDYIVGAQSGNILHTAEPSLVLLGISEGNYQGDVTNNGLLLDADDQTSGLQGSVSAGFPGQGTADVITYGLVTRVGNGSLEEAGKMGQSSATIPHQPLYLGT